MVGGDNVYGISLDALCPPKPCVLAQFSTVIVYPQSPQMQLVSAYVTTMVNHSAKLYFLHPYEIFPQLGETLTIPAVIVGGDYGTTIGTAYANFIPGNVSSIPTLKSSYQFIQWLNTSCTKLSYLIYSKHNFVMYLILFAIYMQDTQ